MELFWLWIPVLGSLMLAELLWTLPIDQDQGPRPEDEEQAEVCIVYIRHPIRIHINSHDYECDFGCAETFTANCN